MRHCSVIMKVGDTFSSYEELRRRLSEYTRLVHNEYWIRDARTIENQRKRYPETVSEARVELRYYYLLMACVCGGRKFKSKNEKSSRICTTSKQDCPAAIHLRLTKCKKFLQVIKIIDTHNHSSSKKPADILRVGIKKSLVLEQPKKKGCNITLKDLTNIGQLKVKKHFEECINMLRNSYKGEVKILRTEDGIFQGMYFQDERMKKYFDAFPEVLLIDGIYSSVETTAYIITVQDSNCQSEIVAVCLLAQENKKSIEFILDSFKEYNPSWEKVNVIMADRDKVQRNVFKKHFPRAKSMISLFHLFQIFNKEITNSKMGISTSDIKISKEHLQKITRSSTHLEYTKAYKKMMASVPSVVQTYFKVNWAPIKDKWVRFLTSKNLCLSNTTNNRLESLNAKLRNVINRYCNLDSVVEHLFALIQSHRTLNDAKNLEMLHKRPAKQLQTDSAEHRYANLLTVFAFQMVKEQLELATVSGEFKSVGDRTYVATSAEGLLRVSKSSCECTFRSSTMLPCQHIFKCRTLLSLPLYDENLCLPRWTKEYCEAILNVTEMLKAEESDEQSMNVEVQLNVSCLRSKHLTKHQKFKMMDEQGRILAQLCSELPTPIFYEKFNTIKNIIKEWTESVPTRTCLSDCRDLNASSDMHQKEMGSVKLETGLNSVKLPERLMKRGHPKSKGYTIIGLKKAKVGTNKINNIEKVFIKEDKNEYCVLKESEVVESHEEIEIYSEGEYLEPEENSENDTKEESLEQYEDSENDAKNEYLEQDENSENDTKEEYLEQEENSQNYMIEEYIEQEENSQNYTTEEYIEEERNSETDTTEEYLEQEENFEIDTTEEYLELEENSENDILEEYIDQEENSDNDTKEEYLELEEN